MVQSDSVRSSFLTDFIAEHKLSQRFLATASNWYIPVIEDILMHHKGAKLPFFVGLNGCQGSGKSTFAAFMQGYLANTHQVNCLVLSLDDFYLDKQHRAKLADEHHVLLATRGVPGTHDTQAMQAVIGQLKQNHYPITVPRFNKATDNPHPQAQWDHIDKEVDIVVFEGWCWGVPAQSEQQLKDPVNRLEAEQDQTAEWRQFVNAKLKSDYEHLYAQMDYWLMLKAPSFNEVFQWRLEQEQKLLAALPEDADTSSVMSDAQVLAFIQHYQRLTEHGLAVLPERCDCVLALNQDRSIEQMALPQSNKIN